MLKKKKNGENLLNLRKKNDLCRSWLDFTRQCKYTNNIRILSGTNRKMITSSKLGKMQANFTVVKDGVDLKERFIDVFENHPLTYAWSDGVKKMIAVKLLEEVMKDAST